MSAIGSINTPTRKVAAPAEIRPDKDWFRWSGRHPLAALLVTGFVATQTATMAGYIMPAFGLPTLAWPLHNGRIGAPGTPENTAASFFVGQSLHYLNGLSFVFVFALLFYRRLPFGGSNLANLARAQIFAVLLAVVSVALLVPRIYAPHAGFGFFSFGHGWKFPLAVLIWHLIYGAHIAALYNPGLTRRLQLEDEAAAKQLA